MKKTRKSGEVRSTILDKAITYLNPQAGLKREQARLAISYMQGVRRFDGASKTSRFEQWRRPGTSANGAIMPAVAALRNSSRDLTRNNPWAENAIRVIVNNTIGSGITGQIVTAKGRERQNDQLKKLWEAWADTTAIDSEGRLDLAGLEALMMHTIAESGEVLIRRRYRRSNNFNGPIPVQIQILEPDFLDEGKDGKLQNGGEIIGGIEYDRTGGIEAYWLRESFPGDTLGYGSYASYRVRASEIIHAFDPKRAGQSRGYPWVASAIRRLKDFDDYEDAQLVRQKIAACFAGFVEDSSIGAGMTGLNKSGPTEEQKDFMQPGMWEHLPPGKKITFASPPGVNNYGEYGTQILRGAAASFGITYEAMTNDYSKVNFSSGRMGWLEMNRNITHWQNSVMRVQILERLAAWFFGGTTLIGVDNKDAYVKWIYPRREMIDPTKEVPATIKAIRAGLTSLPRVHAMMGEDSEEIMNEIAASNAQLDAKKIILDSDPRKVNISGGLNEVQQANQSPESGT